MNRLDVSFYFPAPLSPESVGFIHGLRHGNDTIDQPVFYGMNSIERLSQKDRMFRV